MNYLAHIFLSGIDEKIIIGNFIGDYVKGSDFTRYPPQIQKGIQLHRNIDFFTDTHKIIAQSKSYFAPKYHHYAGIIIDILYDHFLVIDWEKFSPQSLETFKENIFEILKKYYSQMPERVQFFVSSFIQNDWIGVYGTVEGILDVLYHLSMRTTLPDESVFAHEIIRKYYLQLRSEFLTYFPHILKHVIEKYAVRIPLKDNKILE